MIVYHTHKGEHAHQVVLSARQASLINLLTSRMSWVSYPWLQIESELDVWCEQGHEPNIIEGLLEAQERRVRGWVNKLSQYRVRDVV